MTGEKSWYQSWTVWGGIAAMIGGAATGVHFDPLTGDINANLYDLGGQLIPAVTGILGGAGAIFGRLRAKAPIKVGKTPKRAR